MIELLYGNEPYCLDSYKRKALKGIDSMNLDTLKGAFDEDILAKCRTFPFFAPERGIVLDIDSMKELDTPFFREYLKAPSDTTRLVILCRKADARLKIYKELDKKGFIRVCNKVESETQVQKVITYELGKIDARITPDAMTEFIKRINYFGKEDMTLLTAVSYITAVAAVTKEIRKTDIERFVPKFEEPNIFVLASLIKEHKTNDVLKEVNLISPDDAIGVLSLLLRSFRISFNCRFFEEKDITKGRGNTDLFDTATVESLNMCIRIITDTIFHIKSGRIPQEIALKSASAQLMAVI